MEHPPAILARGLTVAYGELVAVDRLDLEVRRGECFGLLGPNGAGKTTAVETFEGLLRPRSGSVEVLGESWRRSESADRRLRNRLGVALQETRLPEKLTVAESLRLFRSFYERGRSVEELIELIGLSDKRGARVGRLSGGQRQRLALACALVGAPELLFLDEPTTGLDPHARQAIWRLVEALLAEGCTVLLTTHYMEEAARLCQRVGIMDHGRLVALDTPEGLIRLLGAEEVLNLEVDGELPDGALLALPGVRRVERRGAAWWLNVERAATALPGVLGALAAAGVGLRALSTRQATLDDVFVHLTGRELGDG